MRKFLKSLFSAVVIVILVILALWLANTPGTARIVWHDQVIETTAVALIVALFAGGYIIYIIFRLWHLLRHGPERWRLRRKLKKLQKGHTHITEGLIAIASGDASEAGYEAVQARKLLGTTTLTQLLQAQAAQLAGDRKAACEIFRAMASHPQSVALGYRGLIMEARRDGNWDEVTELAEKLRLAKPETPWLSLIRFELLARRHEWKEAGLALSQVSATGLMESSRAHLNRAALLIASSRESVGSGQIEIALELAEKAIKQAPDWLPAILELAECQIRAGHKRAAKRTVEKYWNRAPHARLIEIYRTISNSPIEAFKDIELLCRDAPEATISHQVLAEASLAANIWGEARRHLMALISRDDATVFTFRLMSKLERLENADDLGAARWLAKAIDAAADPLWLCRSCGGANSVWHPTCSHCGNFNTLEWERPGRCRPLSTSTPLISNGWLD